VCAQAHLRTDRREDAVTRTPDLRARASRCRFSIAPKCPWREEMGGSSRQGRRHTVTSTIELTPVSPPLRARQSPTHIGALRLCDGCGTTAANGC
jgi:hypothetical protein